MKEWNQDYVKQYLSQDEEVVKLLHETYHRWIQKDTIRNYFLQAEREIALKNWELAVLMMKNIEKQVQSEGEDAYLAIAALVAGLLPTALERQKAEGVPEEVLVNSYQDFEIWLKQYQTYHNGALGLSRYSWVLHTFAGDLLRFGSLQFEQKRFDLPYVLLRKKETEEESESEQWEAVLKNGAYYDAEGYLAYADGKNKEAIYEAKQSQDTQWISGHAVDLQAGRILPEQRKWSLNAYEIAVDAETPVLGIHIPAGADLSETAIRESFAMAKHFYREKNYLVCICESWMLDTHLYKILPTTSRICKFSGLFYHVPVLEETPQILERVFGFDFQLEHLEEWECHTSLQRQLKEYLMAGGKVSSMGGFIPWNLE